MKKVDERSDYEPYAPTPEEAQLLAGYLATLPPGLRRALDERLVGVYFIKNFLGNGLTDVALDENGEVYAIIILNPAGFSKSLSETLTERDASALKGDSGLRVEAGGQYRGILYSILHEGTHAYDYIRGITPYVDDFIVTYVRRGQGAGASWDVWQSYGKPFPQYDYPLRDQARFYGFGGEPLIEARQARRLIGGLSGSPFASVYGSRSWAEDAAELATFYHVVVVLHQPYIIELPAAAGEQALSLEPFRRAATLERARRVYELMSNR